MRNTRRARASENALETAGTSDGWRIRHRFRFTFGRSTPATGFDGISSSATAPFSTSWRRLTQMLTVFAGTSSASRRRTRRRRADGSPRPASGRTSPQLLEPLPGHLHGGRLPAPLRLGPLEPGRRVLRERGRGRLAPAPPLDLHEPLPERGLRLLAGDAVRFAADRLLDLPAVRVRVLDPPRHAAGALVPDDAAALGIAAASDGALTRAPPQRQAGGGHGDSRRRPESSRPRRIVRLIRSVRNSRCPDVGPLVGRRQ